METSGAEESGREQKCRLQKGSVSSSGTETPIGKRIGNLCVFEAMFRNTRKDPKPQNFDWKDGMCIGNHVFTVPGRARAQEGSNVSFSQLF